MDFLSIIEDRREGRAHSAADLTFLAQGAALGTIPDYQLSAWLMAEYLKPLSREETAWLTQAMAETGERLDLTGLPHPWVDKHSTGGVGDKTTLVVLPILAACGLTLVKMSGRGLGITGGTVDKLLSVPGFRMDLTPEEMKAQASRIGLALTGQSPNLAPADKALYALRDATATTESIPLIASSILSKKLAGGCEFLSLDVKCGSGAFMKTEARARELADWLTKIGERCGLKVHAMVTDMDQPLGATVGNAIEVIEAIHVVAGRGAGAPTLRFRELCLDLCAETLHFVGRTESVQAARVECESVLANGAARQKMGEWFAAQGADLRVLDDPEALLPLGPETTRVVAPHSGMLERVDAGEVGRVVVDLGGGRKKKEDVIDRGVGVRVHHVVGDRVERGEALLTVHARTPEGAASAAKSLESAVAVMPH